MYTISDKKNISVQLANIGAGIKKSSLLSGSWGDSYAIATIVVDNIIPPAEVHKNAADVWIALKGKSSFILGGKLVKPTENSPGEFNAESISGGERREILPGDVVDIPAGIPHQIDARGSRAEFLIIKINV